VETQQNSVKEKPESISAIMIPALGIFEGQVHSAQDDNIFRFWDGNSTLPLIGWEGHDEGDTHPNSETSARSTTAKYTQITSTEAAKYLGMDESEMKPGMCSKQYKEVWDETHKPYPINTTMTTLGEEVAQLRAHNKEIMSRVASRIMVVLVVVATQHQRQLQYGMITVFLIP
jgi:hypothetical protein